LQIHCVWAAAEAYSAPSIVLSSHTPEGVHVFDDFREAYAWLSHNTDENDKVHALLLAKYIRTDTTYSLMCNICQNYQNWN
jgi:hypothetical protein